MLEHVKVDGFRSLINFSIILAPGVNVIVGANGTGKTNFVSFLDFLGEMVGNDLNAAIAVSQGAGSVFSKEKFQSDRAELTFDLTGVFDTDLLANKDFYFGNAGRRQSGSYTYSTRITYLRNVPTILIAFEELQLRVVDQGSLSLRRTTEHGTEGFLTHIEFSPRDHPLIKAVLGWDREVKEGRRNASEMTAARLSPNRSFLIEFIGEIAAISSVVSDLTGLRSVNIDPSLARKPTPVGVTQDIGSRGEGLAGALFRLEQGNYNALPFIWSKRGYLNPDSQASLYRSIISWCREVNPGIEGLRVDLDFQEALLRPYLTFRRENHLEELSLGGISDGTVKWLALLAVLHVEPSLSIIEEPENFLHPFMRASFVALCRKIITEDSRRNFILSTHSRIILDCCNPAEMTIFELEDGISRASKVANRDRLIDKIAKSRFGLGHYYRTGGVYGEDRSNS